jgi:DNA-directed RNA polymerase specialized sigma subunit
VSTEVACIGLVKAIDRYEPARGIAFSLYELTQREAALQ